MKRQISILACLVMLLAVVFAVASCTKPEELHVHDYVSAVTKEATCFEAGVVTYTCSCGSTYQDAVPVKEHKLEVLPAVAPTCTTEGKTEGEACSACGLETVPQSTIAALGHELGAPATCTTPQTCARGCDFVFVEALGHKTVAATCEGEAYCSVCNIYQGEALGHTPTEATCTEPSVCTTCEAEVAPALGHKYPSECYTGYCQRCYEEWVDGNGEHAYFYECDPVCMNCEEYTNWEAAHNIVFVAAKAPTCTEFGNTEYYTCTMCNGVWDNEYGYGIPSNLMNVRIGMLDHEYNYACDAHCMNCYELTNEEAAHSLKHFDAVAPTCTTNGNVEYWSCEYCNGAWDNDKATGAPLNKRVIVPALGHSYFNQCDAHCERCYELTNEDAAHSLKHFDAVAPTCTEKGNIEYWMCEFCGACWDNEQMTGFMYNPKTVVLPAAGHSYAIECDPVCLVCHEINEEIAHNVIHVPAKAATCTADGNIEYWYCSYCGLHGVDEALVGNTSEDSVVVPAFGHSGYEYDLKCDTCNIYLLPEAGVALKLGMYVDTKKDTYYITGAIANSYYYATTTNIYASADVYLEEADGGFYLYIMSGTTKKYLCVNVNGTKNNPNFSTSTKALFNLDETCGALITTTSNGKVYLGTYSTYTTVGASLTSYITGSNAANIDKSQHLLRMEILPPHDCDMSEATCSKAPTCSICGKVEGEKLPHTPGAEATCTAAQTCTVCNTTLVAKLAHTGGTATCTQKALCDVCGTAYGSTAAHVGGTATCTEKALCDVCGTAYGSTAAHTGGTATCTEQAECDVCGTAYGNLAAHDFENGVCADCGAEQGLSNATITFNNKSLRTEYSTSKQVWEQNGIKVINNKSASTSNVGDYYNPARFYASSELIIEGKGMKTIKFTCNSSSYATSLKNSITTGNGVSVSVSGSVVTVTFTNAVNSFTIAKLSAQVRVNSITVNP